MRNPIIMNFSLFIGFLIIGYSVSTRFYQPDNDGFSNSYSLTETRTINSIQSLNNGQRNILLIGVNTMDITKAQLEGVWLVTYLPDNSYLKMLPISPSGNGTVSDFEDHLVRSFNLDNKNGDPILDQDFLKLLKENNFWWSGYIVIDHVAAMKILNILGEADEYGEIISGDQINHKNPEVIDNPQKAFAIQIAFMQAACHGLSGLTLNPDLQQIILLSPTHLISDLNLNQLLLEWKSILLNQQMPNCKFPTLEISRNDN
jgi:hypothetical protein